MGFRTLCLLKIKFTWIYNVSDHHTIGLKIL